MDNGVFQVLQNLLSGQSFASQGQGQDYSGLWQQGAPTQQSPQGLSAPQSDPLGPLLQAQEAHRKAYLQSMASQTDGKPAPQFKPAQYGLQDALKAGLPALVAAFLFHNKHLAAGLVQGYMGGKDQAAQVNYQNALAQDQAQKEQQKNQMGVLGTQVGFDNQDVQNAQTQQFRMDQAKATAEAKRQQEIDRTWTNYRGAKSPGALKGLAQRLRTLDPENAPDDATVQGDFNTLDRQNKADAVKEWESSLSHEINQYGEVRPERASDMEALRQATAASHGVPVNTLRSVPTGTSLKKQQMDEHKREFDVHATYLDNSQRQNLAFKRANLTLAQNRLDIAQRNADTAAGGLELRRQVAQYNMAAKQYGDDTDKTIGKLQQRLAGALQMSQSAYDDRARAKAKQTVDSLKGQIKWLQETKQPVIDVGDTMGLKFQMPNPDYKPPLQGGIGGNAPVTISPSAIPGAPASGLHPQARPSLHQRTPAKLPSGWKTQ